MSYFRSLVPDPDEQLIQKYMHQIEAFSSRDDISDEQLDAFVAQKLEEYQQESFEAFVHRVARALASRRRRQDDNERFIEDYTKVALAHYHAPPEERREATKRALREVWERRRREKAAKAKEAEGKK